MNAKKSKSIFKLLALVLAVAFTVLFIPVNELTAWARMAQDYVDYSYIKVGDDKQEIKNTIYTGDKYYIPKAYIGGNNSFVIGDGQEGVMINGDDPVDSTGDVKLVSSKITVTYGSSTNVSDEGSSNGLTIDVEPATEGNSGSFVASRVGTYTVSYAYTYQVYTSEGVKEYENVYDMKVVSSISDASIEIENNGEYLFPSIIDASLLSKHEVSDGVTQYDDVNLPIPTVYDEDGEEVENIILTLDASTASATPSDNLDHDYLLVSMTGGANASDLREYLSLKDLDEDEVDETVTLSGNAFTEIGTNYSSYTIKYSYYHNGQFVVSTTKTATVYNKYYQNYNVNNLTMELDASLTTSAQPGIAQTLPGVVVTTNDNVSPANEEIEVRYKVKVRYRANRSGTYNDLDASLYNKEGEDPVIDSDGYLIDPTTFTPLEEGSYTFNYEAYDFYGNKIGATPDGRYEWENIQDTTTPTAIVYDASAKDENGDLTYEEASDKLARYHAYNGVVVYAVGLEDNLTTVENASLKRVVYANSEELFTIEDYDNKNLVFNYRASSVGNDAYQQLINNNYLIRKAVEKHNASDAEYDVTDDMTMLRFLRENGYLIVIDNGGTQDSVTNTYARSIYNMFIDSETDKSIFNTIEGVVNAESFISYLHDADNQENVKSTLEELGFAYINNDRTFGAQASNGGFSNSAFQIRYVAQDEAGNSNYISRDMTFTTTIDTTPPEVTISTNFDSIYNNTDEVEFAVPTASDDNDTSSRMKVQTYYRFLNADGAITTEIKDEDENVINNLNVNDVFTDLTNQDNTDENGDSYYERYSTYAGAGYINLTDSTLSNYTIDLSVGAGLGATRVQVFAYVYDDYGNVGVVGQEFNISNAIDTMTPRFQSVSVDDNTPTSYSQGDDINLPTITVRDDYVEYMDFNIAIYNNREDGSRIAMTTPSNATQTRNTYDATYTVNAGTFNASFAGDYTASIELKDYNNARIVVFTHYTAERRTIVQEPVANISFENQTVELDDNPVISLPTPTISYSIDGSLDYETYKNRDYSGDNAENEPAIVLIGVDENGNATDYETTYGQQSSFTPTEKGVYTVKYTTRLRYFDTETFDYVEGTTQDKVNGELVNYFTEDATFETTGYKIKIVNPTTYEVYVPNQVSEPTSYTVYTVTKNEKGDLVITDAEGAPASEPITTNITSEVYDNWQENLRMYVWESDNFTVTVNDTTGPKIKSYNYIDAISSDALEKENKNAPRGYKLHVQGIEATDASGIDYSRSTVTITRTYKVDGSTRTSVDSLTDKINGEDFYISQNGTVTIAYTVYDNNGNSSTAEYVIRAGDNTNPIIRVNTVDESDFIAKTYSLSDFQDGLFTVDLTKLTFSDDKTAEADLVVTYEFVNDDTDDEPIEAEIENENQLAYKIESVGNYTLTVTVTDEAGNSISRDFSFEVTEATSDATLTYRVIGTVLIVISVLLLAGVIIYFVVSKVKLDKELKK